MKQFVSHMNLYVWTVYKQPVIPNNLMELFHLNPF